MITILFVDFLITYINWDSEKLIGTPFFGAHVVPWTPFFRSASRTLFYQPYQQMCPKDRNKGAVAGFLPTTESNLRTALGFEICRLGIIARICKPLPETLFSDLCSEIGICSDVM